jgi:peptidoglycan hydrolase CwlO-like protein
MAVVILGLGAWLVYANSTTSKHLEAQQEALATTNAEKSNVQTNFDASLARLDSLSGSNTVLGNELKAKNEEIARIKEEIRTILNKQNVTSEELARAKSLIAKLNGQISGLKAEVARLRSENKYLSDTLAATTVIKQDLEKKVDVASTLNASNIVITPVNVKSNGKEKVSTSARRVDKMVISFDVSNRIVQPGTTDLYVVVVGPDGQQVQGASGTGSFSTREEGDKQYTAKVALDLETAKTKKVAFSIVPAGTFHKGNYRIQIYQNGFLIGEGTRSLKRGGLFG